MICGRAILACPLKGVQNFVLPSQNAEGAPNLTLLLEGVSLQLEAERDTLTFKGYCGIVKYLTKRHLNVNPSVKRWEMTGNPDKSRVVANLNGKK